MTETPWYPAYNGPAGQPLWLDTPLVGGSAAAPPAQAEIVIIGSGLSGVSAAHWLRASGFDQTILLDWRPEDAATNRNCGHILYGTVESAHALTALKGRETAAALLELSVDLCHDVRATIDTLDDPCDYHQDGYLVMAIDDAEMDDITASAAVMQGLGVENRLLGQAELERLGYRGVVGGRLEPGGARAHPVKFRNALLRQLGTAPGFAHHSGVRVTSVDDDGGRVVVRWDRGAGTAQQTVAAEAVVIAANAYSPLLSEHFAKRRLVEPFRGQMIASEPLRTQLAFGGAQSFDRGYTYAVVSPDNRLVIGGWRNHTPGGEVGTYELATNELTEAGLRRFVQEHYDLGGEVPLWTRSWSGIMAASRTGLPFIGPTTSPRIFALAGYTGHGFSWAHGSARILAGIMAGTGHWPPELLQRFSPNPA